MANRTRKRWLLTLLAVIGLGGLALSARWWLPPLLELAEVNSATIEGLGGIIQIALWIGAAFVAVYKRIWKVPSRSQPLAPTPIIVSKTKTEAEDHGVAATIGDKVSGQVSVGENIHPTNIGTVNVFLGGDFDQSREGGEKDSASEDISAATGSYLTYLVDRYKYLELKGMGISDRVSLKLPLREMYVPLKARVEVPAGDTWARHLKLAGRRVSEVEAAEMGERLSKPLPALDLLRKNDGLIILGDPGAGKTTFLKHLTLCQAEGNGDEVGLGGRLPILLPLSAYANALAERDISLIDFIAEHYQSRGTDLPIAQMFIEALDEGRALVLLDGLDEVRAVTRRTLVVERVMEFFTLHRRKGNKFVVTSRIVGYRQVRRVVDGMAECTLVDFDDDDIEQFVEKWTTAIEIAASGDTAVAAEGAERERVELLDAIERNAGVRRLAANPLLLTILALMKRQGVTLPDRRVELYQKYIETLLKHWNLARGLAGRPDRDLDVVGTVRVLAPLALWMHETSPGVGLVKREEMRRKLVAIYTQRGEEDPAAKTEEFLDDVHGYAGLLLERGPGEYGFIHLTFQEYMAAVAIAMLGQQDVGPVADTLGAHIGDDEWHEVSLLTIGYMGIVQQRDEAAGDALARLIDAAPGEPGQATVLAGEAAADAWPGGVSPACRATVVDVLGAAMTDDEIVAARLRASAGASLARLGDPRPGVMTIEGMQFCYVPAGPFWMGSDDDPDALDWEKPAHELDIPYDYWMGQYPVTNAQFECFAEDPNGYRGEGWWTKDGLSWRGNRTGPDDSGEPYNLPNHPAVNVSWYEALAFTRWLTDVLRAAHRLPRGWAVRLPSEAEWEKGARGGIWAPRLPIIDTIVRPGYATPLRESPNPKRRYPWGDDQDPNRGNYDDTGIGATSAVGPFPGGASLYGCQEMSGNVWEWTRSLWGKDWEEPDFRYPYDSGDGRENLDAGRGARRVERGGSFYGSAAGVRCSARVRNGPGGITRNRGFRGVVAPIDSGL